jgi:hypothetical protein
VEELMFSSVEMELLFLSVAILQIQCLFLAETLNLTLKLAPDATSPG